MHSDNYIFEYDQFRLDCNKKHQEQYFYGVGAQHHNARVERSIQNIIYMARTFMIHSSLHWKYHGEDGISLWYFAVQNAVWLHNPFTKLPFRYHTTRFVHQQ